MRDGQLPDPPLARIDHLRATRRLVLSHPDQDVLPSETRCAAGGGFARGLFRCEPAREPAGHVCGYRGRGGGMWAVVDGGERGEGETRAKVVLFLVVEDAPDEAREVVAATEETGDAWDVDDVGADVEGVGEGDWFHGDVDGV
ncbi:predicted protein [Aspergillus terreus NIH2624]|uniref:Uncharacterized protein n=1 Tax=Aspergillus terreus (strain NIH 2624 / FGSC A1156) TaxID=341663 RepID=Q0CVP8_ASPTN|nr:uncharacterized protein ATEG_02236 [Aspergillus terreus NIH2624]EAU37198.1 predicted protein [Aspergillus terreus NIH2624]